MTTEIVETKQYSYVLRDYSQDNDPKWHCCCNNIHVRTATVLLGMFEILILAITVTSLIIFYIYHERVGGLVGPLISGVLWLICIILLIYGATYYKRLLLIPHMIMQAISVLFGIIGIFIIIGYAIAGWVQPSAASSILFIILMTILEIWWLWIVYRCFKYITQHSK